MKKKNKIKMMVTMLLACICLSGCAMIACSTIPSLEELIQQGKEWEERTDLYVPSKETIEEYEDRVAKGETLEEYQSNKNSSTSSTSSSTSTTPAHTHKWEATVTKEATCSGAGEVVKKCSCGKETTETLKKTDHDFELTQSVDGNCSEIGYMVRTCTMCGLEEKIETDFGDHLFFPIEAVKETCETEGSMTKKCEICGAETFETIPAIGHSFTAIKVVVKEATCEEDGVKAYKCENKDCNTIKNEETIPATGHSRGNSFTLMEATFFKDGEVTVTCENCHGILEHGVLPATGGVWRYVLFFGMIVVSVSGISVGIYFKRKRKR